MLTVKALTDSKLASSWLSVRSMLLLSIALFAVLASACSDDARNCQVTDDCFQGERCVDQICQSGSDKKPDEESDSDTSSPSDTHHEMSDSDKADINGHDDDSKDAKDSNTPAPNTPNGCSYPSSPPDCPSSDFDGYSFGSANSLGNEQLGCIDADLTDVPKFTSETRTLCKGEDMHFLKQRFWPCDNKTYEVMITLEVDASCNDDQFNLEIYCNTQSELVCGEPGTDHCSIGGEMCSAANGSISKTVTIKQPSRTGGGFIRMGVSRGDSGESPDKNIQFDYTLTVEQL